MPDSDVAGRQDRAVSERAKSNASVIYSRCGDRSLKAASAYSWDHSESRDQRRYARLLRLEIERLNRRYLRNARYNDIVPWRPRLFSIAWFVKRFGWRRSRRSGSD